MQLKCWREELALIHPWTIARGSACSCTVVMVELMDRDGLIGLGESAPSSRYDESIETVEGFLRQIDPAQLTFQDLAASRAYLASIAPGNLSAKGALDIALHDGAAKRAGQPVHEYLGLGFREGAHLTSFSIGIDSPEIIREKVSAAAEFPILKLKVGVPEDRANLRALREVAPTRLVRIDANEGWSTKEHALEMLNFFAADGHIEFCEQPLPASASWQDLAWLRERSPLPLMADESCVTHLDLPHCVEFFDAVNVKLIKAGGISGGLEALRAARSAGLRTMLGCMIESSVLISAAAHLAALTDYLDLDGNILISNDPFHGPTSDQGVISFRNASEPYGLRTVPVTRTAR